MLLARREEQTALCIQRQRPTVNAQAGQVICNAMYRRIMSASAI